jgi:hypothetical protein
MVFSFFLWWFLASELYVPTFRNSLFHLHRRLPHSDCLRLFFEPNPYKYPNNLQSTSGSPQWSLSLKFPHQNPVYTIPLPHTHYMPCPSHSRFNTLANCGEWYISLSSSSCSFLHSPFTLSLLGLNIILKISTYVPPSIWATEVLASSNIPNWIRHFAQPNLYSDSTFEICLNESISFVLYCINIMLCYVMVWYVVLCYVMLYHIVSYTIYYIYHILY